MYWVHSSWGEIKSLSVWKHLLTFVAIFIEKNFFPCTLFSFVYSISNICLLIKVATLWLSCLIIEKFSFKKLIKNWFVVLMKKLLLLKLIVLFSEERNVEFLYISLTILLKSCRYRKFPIPITKNKNCLLPITEYYLFQMSCSFKWRILSKWGLSGVQILYTGLNLTVSFILVLEVFSIHCPKWNVAEKQRCYTN